MKTSTSILLGFCLVALAHVFQPQLQSLLISDTAAEVAGMNEFDLRLDYDFKRAVRKIVEDCDVNSSGYVVSSEDFVYSLAGKIDC